MIAIIGKGSPPHVGFLVDIVNFESKLLVQDTPNLEEEAWRCHRDLIPRDYLR